MANICIAQDFDKASLCQIEALMLLKILRVYKQINDHLLFS